VVVRFFRFRVLELIASLHLLDLLLLLWVRIPVSAVLDENVRTSFCCDPAKTGSSAILGWTFVAASQERVERMKRQTLKRITLVSRAHSLFLLLLRWNLKYVVHPKYLMLPLQLTHSGFFLKKTLPLIPFIEQELRFQDTMLHPGDQQQFPIHRFCHPVLQEVSYRYLKKLFFYQLCKLHVIPRLSGYSARFRVFKPCFNPHEERRGCQSTTIRFARSEIVPVLCTL
jgi:hypothetical protein